jgi:hypothetical protein
VAKPCGTRTAGIYGLRSTRMRRSRPGQALWIGYDSASWLCRAIFERRIASTPDCWCTYQTEEPKLTNLRRQHRKQGQKQCTYRTVPLNNHGRSRRRSPSWNMTTWPGGKAIHGLRLNSQLFPARWMTSRAHRERRASPMF